MTPDEVRLLDNRYALLFIRGERPIMDLKYDILKHPNVAYTTDGKGKPYIHGKTDKATASIVLDEEIEKYDTEDFEQELVGNYELLSGGFISERKKSYKKSYKKNGYNCICNYSFICSTSIKCICNR